MVRYFVENFGCFWHKELHMPRDYDTEERSAGDTNWRVNIDYLNEISNGLMSVATHRHSKTAILHIDTYWWFANDVIKNIIIQIMIDLSQILMWPIRT